MDLLEEGIIMSNRYFIGIDTSAYTTSLAIIDNEDNIVLDLRKVLEVKKGQKGLRQQEAVFQHINNLPLLIEKMMMEIDITKVDTIACSNKPRSVEDSYMPVFVVGKGQAFILSKILGTKYSEYSHQEGHIGAGIMGSQLKDCDKFLSLHISGGTTELLLVSNKKNQMSIDIIGGTLDLSLGQLIDRIGVELGLPFPCGMEMDKISQRGNVLNLNIPISLKDKTWFNISGLENYFKNLIKDSSYAIEDIFATLFNTISILLYNIIINSHIEYKLDDILITGGVSANEHIRGSLYNKLSDNNIRPYFAKIPLSTDNGVGVAYLAKEKFSSR
ncbi:O-sialoglycoprotein endopeptidase [[Clostridium] ultunense Esp]|uniref:N(6)-L-threonylcarbamoyladenine synthase n=1 Tax=[Clostridium] ultunense Esp TaxID=1288971 RepID=M1ZCW3_9FIRM|nr:O-sialoglycoprotein endopeptidase [Schnuerera ultunensis]CCQ96004.1 O-sialoglycoprotein endopeptidase [[Clostridium] ultunense Esp]SHD77158.1 O-sialoglycoprotein endopeptidase [[Clostridium] ultunense Esp]